MIPTELLVPLNQNGRENRLAALKALVEQTAFVAADPRYINNHIHTTYSFSPYSPTAAAFGARYSGLCTAGIMDHDSIGGAREFLEAGDILDLPTTIGVECRVSMAHTSLAGKRTNNPDQLGVSYMTLHAVPHARIDDVQAYFAPRREKRNARNRKMVSNINALLAPHNIFLDFERDVRPLSQWEDGGSITERHLMLALAYRLEETLGRGAGLAAFFKKLSIPLSDKQLALLKDTAYPYYSYDVLNILKGAFVPHIYVPATDECPHLKELVAFAQEIGAILCYAYLGDVAQSSTGDKTAQAFEDAYLEELFALLKQSGVHAITYMPPRNTAAQLQEIRALAKRYGMFQISGEDINSPRQAFVCKAMEDPQFENLIRSTWALIAHERGEHIQF